MKKVVFGLLLVFTLLIPVNAFAINEVNIYLFYKESCDFCKQEKVYLEALKKRYPNIRIYSYEVNDSFNNKLMEEAKQMYGITKTGVPFTVIGDSAYMGFSQPKKAIFQKRVYEYSTTSYQNKLGKRLGISYRNDLEGKVEEYKDNDEYQIEESSGIVREPTKSNFDSNKYKASFYLIGAGLVLAVLYFIVRVLEKRGIL